MKAVVVRQPGDPSQLELTELPDPVAAPGEVLVAVAASALNRADLLQRRGLYPPPPGASPLLGLECAGTVIAHGRGVSEPALGSRVMALLPGGGYAELATVPAGMAIPIPERLSFAEAAAIPEAFLTAQEALLTRGRLAAGEIALIHAGASGVGSAAVQLALQHGATVIATCGSPEKAAAVRALGVSHVVDYRSEDFVARVAEVSQGRGADVIVDFVGGAYWEKHARCLAAGGRCVVVGLLGGASAKVDLARLLSQRHELLGLVMRTRSLSDKLAITRRFVREALPLVADGRLRPVIDSVLPLAEVRRAHERMEQNANIGKIVLQVRDATA